MPWLRLVPLATVAHAVLGERAMPVLRVLAGLTGESANLAVLTQGRAQYVSQAQGRHAMRIFSEVGNRVQLHCTGVGKALLAVVPPEQASRLIAAAELTCTPRPRSPIPPRCRPSSTLIRAADMPSTRAR